MSAERSSVGRRMHDLVAELYPVLRSITGEGIRGTLSRIGDEIPLELHEVPSGTEVLDWTVPDEWTLREAYVENAAGERVVDVRDHTLHIVGYSEPVDRTMRLEDLRPHLHSLPEHPDWIPYRTSYYERSWGFCLRHRTLESLPEGEYRVVIDAALEPGSLTYGECLIPGKRAEEWLVSCHVCHPSLANDNLSGIAVAVELARKLLDSPLDHSVRVLFIPGTIGSITWLARNRETVERIRGGMVLSCLGDPGPPTWKRTRRGDAPIDRAAIHALRSGEVRGRVVDFEPYGYDERQYGSPGFDLAVGVLSRSRHGEFPEYHTSADDLDLVRPEALADSLDLAMEILETVDHDRRYRNLKPFGEPQLGRRGLYKGLDGQDHLPGYEMALLWVLNQSDGSATVMDIATRSGLPIGTVGRAVDRLLEAELLAPVEGDEG